VYWAVLKGEKMVAMSIDVSAENWAGLLDSMAERTVELSGN
jgi:hypothetical protein